MKKRLMVPIMALLSGGMLLVNCTKTDKNGMARVAIIVGDAEFVRKGVTAPLVPQQSLRAGDSLRVGEDAKVKLELAGDATWYVNHGTLLELQPPVTLAGEQRRIPIALFSGELHIVKRNEAAEEYLITTGSWKARITAADVTVSAREKKTGVMLLSGFATFTSAEGTETVIPACNRLSVGADGTGTLKPVSSSDLSSLKEWVGSTVIDEAVARSDCSVEQRSAENAPPVWQRLPGESAVPGESYADTVEADDPEQGPLTYALSKKPDGMTIDAVSGVISYPSPVTGTHELVLIATDNAQQACTASVMLSVSAGLTLRVSAPRQVEPGKKVTIAGIVKGVEKNKVRYRFDCNGDGVFDVPSKGRYGKRAYVGGYVFPDEGVYLIRIDAKAEDGQTVSAKRRIVVNAPPVVRLSAVPENAAVGKPVALDLSASTDSRNGSTPLKIRIDVDGDGAWDLPGGTGYTTERKMVYTWEEPGTYRVIAEVKDKDGAVGTATVQVTVNKGIQGGSISCPDTVHIGDSVTITCTPRGGAFPVASFAWSFNGDTVFEKTGSASSVKTSFAEAGIRSLLCRMTDEKGGQATNTKVVTVINSSATVDAGGPYRGKVKTAIAFAGAGSDKDSKIVACSWDFDGDGTVDWTSETSAKTTHVFPKAGNYMAYFTVKTDDGAVNRDSAEVRIVNEPPVATVGDDILSRRNRKVKLTGIATDPDSNIVLYEWDFDGDGTADWSSKENSMVEHAFTAYSEAVFRVRDADGATASDTIKIIICPDDMRTVEGGKFCIDTYEFPNKRNTKPQVNVTYSEALQICRSLGKRLCTSAEWEMACTDGRGKNKYPYGKRYDVDKCNTLGNPRVKNSLAKSGEFFDCKTGADIFDMSGNLAEWTEGSGNQPFAYGGSWQNGLQGSGCDSKVQLGKDRKYFYVGFRCCK